MVFATGFYMLGNYPRDSDFIHRIVPSNLRTSGPSCSKAGSHFALDKIITRLETQ